MQLEQQMTLEIIEEEIEELEKTIQLNNDEKYQKQLKELKELKLQAEFNLLQEVLKWQHYKIKQLNLKGIHHAINITKSN